MDRDPKQQPDPAQPETTKPKPRKRFQLEKLEERIAPAAHYNPQSQWVGTGNGGGGGGGSSTSSGLSGSVGTIY